jgi:hypothetical protein
MRAGTQELLKRTLKAHASGPAKLVTPAPEASQPAATPSATAASPPPRQAALAREADHILLGREISISGMRVDPSPLLGLGRDVRLAIHAGSDADPLVLTARVHRDDGERGMLLRFHELSESATRQLHAVIDELPLLDPSRDSGGIVSQILSGPA